MTVTNKIDALVFLNDKTLYRAAKRLARNTWRYTSVDGVERVRLHHTDIIEFLPKGRVKLTTGGWRSVTTKDRMSNYSGYNIQSQRGQWFVNEPWQGEGHERRSVPYYDGIILPDAFGKANNRAKTEAARVAKLAKSITKFCQKIGKLKAYPMPSAGDCLMCKMDAEKPVAPGRSTEYNTVKGQTGPGTDTGHLYSHISEGYIHGQLLVNAMRWAGRQDVGIQYLLSMKPEPRGIPVNDVRRYLRRKLGVG